MNIEALLNSESGVLGAILSEGVPSIFEDVIVNDSDPLLLV